MVIIVKFGKRVLHYLNLSAEIMASQMETSEQLCYFLAFYWREVATN